MNYPINYIRFSNQRLFQEIKLTLGQELKVLIGQKEISNCLFIKVTNKGFNILNLDTNRCILRKHAYARGMGGKEFPKNGAITGYFIIPAWMSIIIKKQSMEGAG